MDTFLKQYILRIGDLNKINIYDFLKLSNSFIFYLTIIKNIFFCFIKKVILYLTIWGA